MFTIRKYNEGIFLEDNNTGQSRLLKKEEEIMVLKAIPELTAFTIISYFLDKLPRELKELNHFE